MEFHKRKLVYVAGPYTRPDPIENTHETILLAERLMRQETITAFVPHLTLLWHIVVPHDAEHWYAFDMAVLNRCDAVYRREGASTGADREVAFAIERLIPVFEDEESILQWARP